MALKTIKKLFQICQLALFWYTFTTLQSARGDKNQNQELIKQETEFIKLGIDPSLK